MSAAVIEGPQYLLQPNVTERERLALQAAMWEPATERLLAAVGPVDGWRCLDLGCGAPGALRTLARAAGPQGNVVGVDVDPALLTEAARWIRAEGLDTIELRCADAFATGLPDSAFDLVHARFMFAPLGRHDPLLAEIERLVKPGGLVAIQEPDAAAWQCWPPSREFDDLVAAIVATFAASGGDFNAGRGMQSLLRARGWSDVGVRAEALALPGTHSYARLPLLFAASLEPKLVAQLGRRNFERLKAGCAAACAQPDARVTAFVVQQTWARKAGLAELP